MRLNIIALVVFISIAPAALAQSIPGQNSGPKLLGPGDPESREISAAAVELLTAIGEGNDARARELFAGNPAQVELLDAELRMIHASSRLVPAMRSKFGDHPVLRSMDGRQLLAARIDQIRTKFFTVNGERACVASGLFLDQGMLLRRVNAAWRVESLSNRASTGVALREMLDSMTAGFDDASVALANQPNATFDDIGKVAEARVRPGMQRWMESSYGQATPSTMADVPEVPANWSPISLDRLRGAFAHTLIDKETSELIGLLPNLPILSETQEAIFVSSLEAGLAFHFAGKDGRLLSIAFHTAGHEGYRGYEGMLPGKLSFSDVRRDVERKLGRPSRSSGGGPLEYEAEYGGLWVTYLGKELRDPNNRIAQVVQMSANPMAEQPPVAATPRPRLTFQLVAKPDHEHDANVRQLPQANSPANKTLPVVDEILLDASDIESSYPMPARTSAERNSVGLKMTPAGSEKLRKVTEAHVGEGLAIVLDGEVLMAPRINGPIQSNVAIDMGNEPADEFRDIARKIHLAISALPDEQSSTRP